MLAQLTIANVVLIEHLVIEFHAGFNVLTGETGAGKSMVVGALALVLGGRAKPEMIRQGAKEAEVEALFEIDPKSPLAQKLEAAGIPCGPEGELVIRRTVQSEGRSRAYLNGRMCTAAQLTDLSEDLCDIASQHESVSLTDSATHAAYLDAFGSLDGLRDGVSSQFDELSALAKEVERLIAAERGRAEREDFLEFQLREIDELDPRPNEEAELESERSRLRHAGRLGESTRRAAERLYEGEAAVCDELGRIASDLLAVSEIDTTLLPVARAIDAARAELADSARVLGRYAETVEASPERLNEVEERLFRLQKLLRKFGPTAVDVIAHRAQIAAELELLRGANTRITELEEERTAKLRDVAKGARELSRKRRAAAERLADAIGRELAQLGMGRARVIVDVATTAASAGEPLEVDGAKLTRGGIDRVEFLIAPNKGEDPRPLRKIASGGELSRALLALKRVLAENGPAGLYVFDEVDAGVGGAVAEVIGRAIAEVAKHRQVLCVTHLSQIAALGDVQFVVGKSETRGRTVTTVKRLTEAERVDEIARMIGGVKVGSAAKKAAEEMLASRGQ